MAYVGFRPAPPMSAYAEDLERYGFSSTGINDHPGYEHASDDEIGFGVMNLEYNFGVMMHPAQLRKIFNDVRTRWDARKILVELSRMRVRHWIPGGTKSDAWVREAVRSTIMTILSARGLKRQKHLRRLRAQGVAVPVVRAHEHAADETGQYDLGFA